MSWLSDSSELVSGGWLSSAYAGHGVRGDQVPSTGTHGPAAAYPFLSLPSQNATQVRWLMQTYPSAGTFDIGEDTGFTLTGAPDGIYTFTGILYFDGVSQGLQTHTITVGPVGAIASGAQLIATASVFGGAAFAGAATVAQGATIQATASIQGGSALSVGGSVTAQGAQITVTPTIRGGAASNGAIFGVLGSLAGKVKTTYPQRPPRLQSGNRY